MTRALLFFCNYKHLLFNCFQCGIFIFYFFSSLSVTNSVVLLSMSNRDSSAVNQNLTVVYRIHVFSHRVVSRSWFICFVNKTALLLSKVILCFYCFSSRKSFGPRAVLLLQISLLKVKIFKGICQLFFCYLPPSRVPDKQIDTILLTVRAVTRKRRAELSHR